MGSPASPPVWRRDAQVFLAVVIARLVGMQSGPKPPYPPMGLSTRAVATGLRGLSLSVILMGRP